MKDLFNYIDLRIEQKRKAGRHSTADMYRTSGNWFKRFHGNGQLLLKKISASQMADFYNYLKNQGLKPNSITSYLSSIRAIYNTALKDGLAQPGKNPFAGLKLKPEKTVKPVIPVKVMEEIANLDLHLEPELELAADINSFGFMACGMPFVDIVRLTAENIQGDVLTYNRHKTGTQVCIYVTKGMRMLIDKYRSTDHPFLFPVLDSEKVSYEAYKKCLRTHNKYMCNLGMRLQTPYKLTSYAPRRSWAVEAQRKHVSIPLISQALGHTTERTTWFYLTDRDPSELFKANKTIIKDVNNSVIKGRSTLFTE